MQELMSDPVMVATGHTYDRVCIERWLAQGNRTCPVTGMRLRHLELTPNFALRNAVQVIISVNLWCHACYQENVKQSEEQVIKTHKATSRRSYGARCSSQQGSSL